LELQPDRTSDELLQQKLDRPGTAGHPQSLSIRRSGHIRHSLRTVKPHLPEPVYCSIQLSPYACTRYRAKLYRDMGDQLDIYNEHSQWKLQLEISGYRQYRNLIDPDPNLQSHRVMASQPSCRQSRPNTRLGPRSLNHIIQRSRRDLQRGLQQFRLGRTPEHHAT